MRRVIFVGLVLVFMQIGALAQPVKISGKVSDSLSTSPIEYATITLFAKGEKKALTGTTTDKTGSFELTGIKEGTYNILVESIGYRSTSLNNVILAKKNPATELKNIVLSKNQEVLKGVTVIAQKGLIENKIDKIVFNAEKDLTSQGGVATDILKKVPQVSVDVDGNVELAGSTSIKFLINGKPSTAFGSSISDVLQSIPASQIKSIEVITNPGAKYDAEGLGGIINIILKQNTARGINGNLSLTTGTRMENGSFNLNARNGNFGMNAFVSGNYRLPADMPTTSDRLSSDTSGKTNSVFHQDGSSRFTRHGIQSGIGFDWTLQKKNNFTGTLGYDVFGFEGNGLMNQSQITNAQGGGVVSDIVSTLHSNNAFRFRNFDASLNYKRKFDKEDQELEISGNTSFGNNHIMANSSQYLQPQDSLYYGTKSVNPGTSNETEVQIDYTQPFSKDVKLGLGGKMQLRDINSESTVLQWQPASKSYVYSGSLSNNLNYHQKVFAGYAELSFPVAGLFDARLGGRYERTDINSYFSNAQQQAKIPGYNTFVPSVFFLRHLASGQTLKLSFSKRIERPDYRDLNPFINTTDPKNLTRGNPYLQPEIGYRLELSYSRDLAETGSFMVTAFYRTSDHDIQPYIVYYNSYQVGDSSYSNVAVSTNQNIGLEKNLGLSIFNDLHFSKKLNIRTNLFFFHRNTVNALDPGYNSNSFNYRLNMNISYQFAQDLAAEFFGNFNSARHEVQGKYPSFTSYSFAIRKQFWNKKGSLAFTAINPFNQYVNQATSVYGPNFSVNGLRKVPFRSIALNFTWKFGKLEFKKEKKEENGGNNLNPPSE